MSIPRPLHLGPLPAAAINATLGTELPDGPVYLSARAHEYLSARAHEHIARDHAADYPIVTRHLRDVVARPTFVGQAPHHGRNMELVGRVPLGGGRGHVLVAVGLEPDDAGRYRVRTAYLLEEHKVEDRRRRNHLRLLAKS